MARVLMIQGTHSGAGKSLIVTGLCRIFAQDRYRVAPFKAQNMSLNAGVTPEGGEMGRAQIVQAEAAGIPPHTDMNPILLKPEDHRRSQVVLNGRAQTTIEAGNFYSLKRELWPHVTAALDRLRAQVDLVVIEGAGSPAEINLKAGDIVNMRVAQYAQSPVLLVGDIDRGGVFAALVGTMALLEPEERALVKGFLINKFRGDPALLGDGPTLLQQRAFDTPTLGVIPYLPDLNIAEEDSVALDQPTLEGTPSSGVDIAILRLPHLSNFDEFDSLKREPGVQVRFVERLADVGEPQAIILPGSKMTLADLQWLSESGLAERVREFGGAVVGLCGGYQLLGDRLHDPHGVESPPGSRAEGLGLLPVATTFAPEKHTTQTSARVIAGCGAFAAVRGTWVRGYEIHAGHTELGDGATPVLQIDDRVDGATSPDGRVWGCYLHGIFENDAFRHAWLRSLGWQGRGRAFERESAYNRLADHVRAHVELARIYELIG
ncbi:MAG: cobyric acid synthase [Chloroflexi bacterium]|nr:cobyric acid synthase [Chloroflexota bacterium]